MVHFHTMPPRYVAYENPRCNVNTCWWYTRSPHVDRSSGARRDGSPTADYAFDAPGIGESVMYRDLVEWSVVSIVGVGSNYSSLR